VRYAYPDSNASNNGNIYTDSNSCCHGYGYSYSNSNRYSYCHCYAYCCWNSHTYANFYLHCGSEFVEQCGRLSKRQRGSSGTRERWHLSLFGWRLHRWCKQRG
jgi:hypothetical protein